MKSLTLFNQPIRIGEDGMICLTDMWKASGKVNLNLRTTTCETSRPKSSWLSWRKTTNLWFLRNAVRTVELMAESSLLMITQHG